MLLLEKLKNQSNFTDAERVLANYILDNLTKISKMTIYELSEYSFCSVATISRFCKKLKMKNFGALKIELTKECISNTVNQPRVTENLPFSKEDNEETIAKKLHDLSIQTLNDCFSALDLNTIQKAAVLIDQAESIDIYGNWISYVNAINLHSKLLWIGKNSNLESIRGFQMVKAQTSNSKHLAIIISYFGSNERNIEIARRLKENNVPYILITGPKINPLCLYATQVIHVSPDEDFRNKIATFSSEIALDYVINILISFVFSLHYDEHMNTVYGKLSFPYEHKK